MVIIALYDEIKEIEQIPEKYESFLEVFSNLYAIDMKEIDNLVLEYSIDGKNFIILNKYTYISLYSSGKVDSNVNIYFSMEESRAYQTNPKNEEKHEVKINENINENKNENINNEVKSGEITKDMVIASIVKQVKENMQRSKILLKKKEEEEKRREEEERIRREKEEKGVSDQINNLITDKLNNLKNELINDSIIKYSQLLSESQINLKNMSKGNRYDENKEKINSLEEHPEISCSECGISPIVGNRYCCVYCQNLNYCEKCEEKNGFNHGHPLYKFKLRIV
jgi:hypothetical protein